MGRQGSAQSFGAADRSTVLELVRDRDQITPGQRINA